MPAPPATVTVALSGGVDSAVAALLLLRAGHRLNAIVMQLHDDDPAPHRARLVADHLALPLRIVDLRERFDHTVITDFCAQYAAGRTPNPCVRCNEWIKFGALLDLLDRDARLATGHYARVGRYAPTGRWCIRGGAAGAKEQSYFLYRLSQKQLARCLFPLGDLTKDQVRQQARAHDLPIAGGRESQDICFAPGGDYRPLLAARCPAACQAGDICLADGRIIGRHQGLARYTIGQRRGIGIAAAEPLYVTGLDAARNTVVVGSAAQLESSGCHLREVCWMAIDTPTAPLSVLARVRYRHREVPATVTVAAGGETTVAFATPQRAVTPGQSLVMYDADSRAVLGGGLIDATDRQQPGNVKVRA